MSRTFADLLKEGMARKRRPDGRPWGPYQLQGAIGLLDGDRPFNITQVQRLLSGERRTYTHDLIERLIEVLELDPAEAWAAAGLLPPGVTADMLRKLDMFASLAAAGAGTGRAALTRQLGISQDHVKGLGQVIPFPVHRRIAVPSLAAAR